MEIRIKTTLFCFIALQIMMNISAKAQPHFQWVQSDPVGYSQTPFGKAHLAKGSGTSFWYAQLDSAIGSFQIPGTWNIKRVDATGTVFSQFSLGTVTGIVDMEELSGDVLISGSFVDSLTVNGTTLDLDTTNSQFITSVPFVARLSPTGQVVWYRNFNTGTPFGRTVYATAVSPSGEVYCSVTQPGGGTKLFELDNTGATVDSIIMGGSINASDFGFDAQGNLFVVGATGSGPLWQVGNFSIAVPYSYAIYVAKILPSKNAKWVRFTEDITFPRPQLHVNSDGSCYVAGDLDAPTQWDNIPLGGAQWVYDFYLVRIDTAGFAQWARELPLQQPSITGDFSLSNGRYMSVSDSQQVTLLGFTRGFVDFGNGLVTPSAPGTQSRIVCVSFDSSGTPLWYKSVNGPPTALAPYDIIHQDTSWYLSSVVGSVSGLLFDTIPLNTTTGANSVLARLSYSTPVVTSLTEWGSKEWVPYPNPASTDLFIPGGAWEQIEVVAMDGRRQQVYIIPSQQGVFIDVRNLPNGPYLTFAYDKDNIRAVFRFHVLR